MTRLALAWLLVGAVSGVAPGAASSAWAGQAAGRPAPLVMAFTELPPWTTYDGQNHTGAYTEILRELARRVGRKLNIVDCPVKRCLAMLETGTADLTIGIRDIPERTGYMGFLRTPYRLTVADRVFWVRRGDADRIQSYEDLLKLRIGVVPAGAYFAQFDADTRLDKETAQSSEANLQKLVLGRVDTVPMSEDRALVLIRKLQLQELVEPAKFRVQDLTARYVGFSLASKSAQSLLPRMEAAMQAMRQDGTLDSIYERYYYRLFGVSRQQIRVD